jgi:hypothetical protein
MSGIDAGPAWSAWSQVTPVVVGRAARAPYLRVEVPLTIAPGHDGGYPDLRVVDVNGSERPYALDPERPRADDRAVALIDVGYVPRRGTQGVVDLGTSGAVVDTITLEVDSAQRPTYFEHVAVDASDDRRTWRIVRTDAIVYRVAQDGGHTDTTLTFPPTRSRWIRVRVLDPNVPFPLTGARAASSPSQPAPLERVPAEPRERDDPVEHAQVWTFAPDVPVRVTAVTFTDGGARYERSATVETSDDDAIWAWQGEGSIAHYAEGGSQTLISTNETTARFVRVVVHNGDDAAISTLQPTLLVRSHAVVFAAGGTPLLLSGNPKVWTPTYDLGAQLAHAPWTADDATTAPTVANPGFRDSRPLLERLPWLLTAALLAAALGLGLVALRMLRPAKAS